MSYKISDTSASSRSRGPGSSSNQRGWKTMLKPGHLGLAHVTGEEARQF